MSEVMIETYECTEVADESPEGLTERAAELVTALKMEGQATLAAPRQVDGRCPYPEMTAAERFVWETICPVRHDLKTYAGSAIPVRVLETIAAVQKAGYLQVIQIWSAESVVDPLVVGHVKNSWDGKPRLIARWGLELDEWPARLRAAIQIHRWKIRSAVDQIKIALAGVEAQETKMSETELPGSFTIPTFYC